MDIASEQNVGDICCRNVHSSEKDVKQQQCYRG